MRVPAKEREPRVEHENFYFAQEDWLRARQQSRGQPESRLSEAARGLPVRSRSQWKT